jgi:hypothetical protein
MRRRVFDLLASATGALLVVVLAVAGGLLLWGNSFASNSVHDQLAKQQIFFPPQTAFDHAKAGTGVTPDMIPYLAKYAGQQVLTGPQAAAYADHFIAVHLSAMPYGGVYAKISAAAMADPKNTQLQDLKTTSFQGTTLRGLLLEAYAFGTFATIALWAAIASFAGAFLMAILVGLGLWHARRTPPRAEILPTRTPEAIPAS